MNILGPDVSFYQDSVETSKGIDFAKMKAAGAAFVIIRAGQNRWADRDIQKNWQAAKAAGLPRGAYWFYDSRIAPKDQADLWISVLGDDLGELPLWCDFEDRYGGAFGTWDHWYQFIERVKVLAPNKKIGIYTGYYYWLEKTAEAGVENKEYFAQFPLWIARYNASEPLVPFPWVDWTLWQFTDNGDGTLYGVESKNIDLNYFNGSADDFARVFGIGAPVEENDPIEEEENNTMTTYSMTPINSGTRMRVDHNTFAAVLRSDLKPGDVIVGDEVWTAPADGVEVKKNDRWLKVVSVNGVAVTERGWVAIEHKGSAICEDFKEVVETAPEYADVDLRVNIYQGEMSVTVNGEEWVKKAA